MLSAELFRMRLVLSFIKKSFKYSMLSLLAIIACKPQSLHLPECICSTPLNRRAHTCRHRKAMQHTSCVRGCRCRTPKIPEEHHPCRACHHWKWGSSPAMLGADAIPTLSLPTQVFRCFFRKMHVSAFLQLLVHGAFRRQSPLMIQTPAGKANNKRRGKKQRPDNTARHRLGVYVSVSDRC